MTPNDPSLISAERVERAIQLRYSPFPSLTMEMLTQQLNQFRIGELRAAARTWEIMMERDGELSGPANKRYADAARLQWTIEKDEKSAEADRHEESLRYFYTHLTATNVLDQDESGGLNLLVRQMMTAHAYRYSAHEMQMIVNSASKREVTAQFNHCPVWFFNARNGRLNFLQHEGDWDGIQLERGQWLPAVGYGLMRPCSVGYLAKHSPLRDWLFYSTRFGIPGVQGLTDAPKGSQEWNDFAAALREFANRWITITSKNPDIKLIETAKGSGDLPFKELVERTDRLYARLFRGGDLSTQSRSGDSNGASLQDEEKDLILADDAQWLTDTLNGRVDEPLIEYLYGAAPKAWIRILPPKKIEADREIKSMEFLADRGGRVSLQTAHDRLQVPMAYASEELVQPAKVPAAPAPGLDPALANAGDLASNATAQITAAMEAQFTGLAERFQRILAIQDADLFFQALEKFLNDLDRVKSDMLADPAVTEEIARTRIAALLNGAEQAAKARKTA